MATRQELAILATYSTPGLRKGQLDEFAKRFQLASMGVKPADADKIISELFPSERAIAPGP